MQRSFLQSVYLSLFHGYLRQNVTLLNLRFWAVRRLIDFCLSLDSQNKEITNRTLQLIDDLGSTLLTTKVVGERPSVFTTTTLNMILDRQTPAKMSRKIYGDGIEKVALPSTETLFGKNSGDLQSVDAQVI